MRAWLHACAVACVVTFGCGGDDGDEPPSDSAGSGGMTGGQGGAAGTIASGGAGGATGGSGGMSSGGQGGAAGESPEDIGTFTGFTGFDRKLAVGRDIACAIGGTGEVTCQGSDAERWDPPPAGPFERIALGEDSVCALGAEGLAVCWGNVWNDLEAPEGPFTALAVQGEVACGIRPTGRIRCWGDDTDDLLAPPEGTFTDLVMHDDEGCALASDGHIECWGRAFDAHGRVDGVFTQLARQYGNLCTLDIAGKIACHDSYAERYADQYSAGTYTTFSVANGPVCGIKADGEIDCFDDNSLGRLPPPEGPWVETAGYYSGQQCARAMDGRFECWGEGYGDGAATLACTMGQTKLDGTVGGEALSIDVHASPQYSLSDLEAGYRFAYTTGQLQSEDLGFIVLDGDAPIGRDSVALRALEGQGEVAVTRSIIMRGGGLSAPGELLCTGADSGSTISLHVDEVALELLGVHALGACPGTPVEGELTLCYGGDDCMQNLSGTLEGMAIEGRISQGGLAGSGLTRWFGDQRDLFMIVADEAGAVTWAVYVSGPDTPFAGAVYCAGAGSTVEVTEGDGFGDDVVYTLRNLSKMDSCPTEASTDSLSGCVR